MANGIRTGDPRGFNKGRSSKFREGSRVRQIPEEIRMTYRPKRCRNNNKDEDNSPKTLYDKNEISHEKTWTWLRKGNPKRETESLLIAAQNNSIRTNYFKAKIDRTQQNSKCRLCGDINETINHIISKCSKLAQKEFNSIHDWVRKVNHWLLCKKFKFEQVVYAQPRIYPGE